VSAAAMSDPGAILITGCSSGIGRATAEHLARADHTVFATARSLETIEDLKASGCRTLALDVLDEQSMRAAVEAVESEHGAVGTLVNNAGYAVSGAIESVPIDAVRKEFETNVFGYVRMAQLVLPAMRGAGRGRIVNLSSVAGRVTMPGAGAYAATKYAVEALSDALRFEVRGFGVHVIVIEPGPIRSSFTTTANAAIASDDDGPYGVYHAAVAKGDAETDESFLAGSPEQVAKTIERAITAERPRPRYRVTPIARLLPALRGTLGDRGFDAFLRTQIKPPGRA
jgi:NAD(P)-dependent dehydrogenase (short-subunit alcohol dehydrogenase family)